MGDFSCAVHGKTLRIWGATWFAFIAVPCPGPTSQHEAGVQRLRCIRTPFTNADRPFRTPYSVFRWPQNRFTSVNSRWHPENFPTSSSVIRKVFLSRRRGGGKKSKSPYKIDPVCCRGTTESPMARRNERVGDHKKNSSRIRVSRFLRTIEGIVVDFSSFFFSFLSTFLKVNWKLTRFTCNLHLLYKL